VSGAGNITKVFLTIISVFAICWHGLAGPLEHLGIIPHVHPTSDFSGSTDSGKKSTGSVCDHHHLPDLAFTPYLQTNYLFGVELAPNSSPLFPPDEPVFGITYPPQRI
jgi:hypothetical protein